jgi:exopolysaccharide biosynthesis protein
MLYAPGDTGKKELDLNYWNGTLSELYALAGRSAPVPEYQKLRRYGSDVYVLQIDPKVKRVHVTDTHGVLETPRAIADRLGAKYVVNGDMWAGGAPYVPDSLAVSDGHTYHEQIEARPFLGLTRDGVARITHTVSGDLYSAVSGVRYLVRNGVCSLDPARPDYSAMRDPRTLCGIRADNRIVLIVVDGRCVESDGVTLIEGANLLLEQGVVTGMDLDGGGSSQMIVDGVLANVPRDIDDAVRERAVVNHIAIGMTAEFPKLKHVIKIYSDGTTTVE